MRREDRRRGARERLELPERVGVDDDRQVERRRARGGRRLCVPSLRPRPGPSATARIRSAASTISGTAPAAIRPCQSSLSGRFTTSSELALEHRQRRGRRGDGDVARVGAERRPRGEAGGAREPARAADDEHGAGGVLVVAVALGGTRSRISSRTSRCRRLGLPRGRCRRSATVPAWNRPGATCSPTFGPWKVTVAPASTAAPAISPVEASTPDGTSTATTGRPSAVDLLDQRAPPRAAARR